MPEITATGNNATLFNSGVMVIEPSNCTFQLLMEHINEITSYNGGDQGYLNEIFTWWHRIPKHMNFLKHFWEGDEAEKANFTDGHWKRNITDPRLKTCFEKFCFWESMLWHWGENKNNSTQSSAVPATPAATSLSSS
uniref:Uncharacterized protein n=1 Tax=Zea mays TaxID=4577 RepID=B4FEK3_MAIZE|nr:unknown [Zea mays]